MKTRSFILILLISGCSSSIFAHNTNVIHPLITIEALKLIKEEDQNADANLLKAYSELYFTQDEENRYWGNNPYFDEGDAIEDEEKDYEAFRSQPLNVMGGGGNGRPPSTQGVFSFLSCIQWYPNDFRRKVED